MHKIRNSASNSKSAGSAWDHGDVDVTKPLTKAQADALRLQQPALSPGWVLAAQAVGGILTAMAAWLVTGSSAAGWSACYGATAVVLPGALFARGVMSKVARINPAAAVTGFFLWEMVKIGLVLAMLFAAPKLVADVSWPAMLVGLVVTMKMVWPVLWLDAKFLQKRGANLKSKIEKSKIDV